MSSGLANAVKTSKMPFAPRHHHHIAETEQQGGAHRIAKRAKAKLARKARQIQRTRDKSQRCNRNKRG